MKISYNWLKQYVDFKLSPEDLGEVLTGVGLETESITKFESVEGGLQQVVIGEVIECVKHPDADKLSVTKVNVGQAEPLQIVCGAPNVAVGQKVVVALSGATLYPTGGERFTIKKAKIRGVESNGMICAEDEIGLGQSHAGIMVLDSGVTVGTPAADYFKIETDYILDIGLTPNRGDANSHIGVARDLYAALNVAYQSSVTLSKPDTTKFKEGSETPISVEVKDNDACIRYTGVTISGVSINDSPEWLKNRLKAIGVKPVNNVVDITNYVLHEYGQPLHAFDADKISGNKVLVQPIEEQASFTTLDNKEVKLAKGDLMIANAESNMCIAGVYGGADSGVKKETKNIFLESACFSPFRIRKTATRLNLRTDAATHYEKGTDPNITVEALKRAALLITEIAGGRVSSSINDIYLKPVWGWQLEVSQKRIEKLAGFQIESSVVKKVLELLEIKMEKEEDGVYHLLVPAFKSEVKREADVLEEILRIIGYNSFTLPKKINASYSLTPKVENHKLENVVAESLCGAGFQEIWTNSISSSHYEQNEEKRKSYIGLLNSQTSELNALRTDILYSGLEVIAYNQNRKTSDLQLFEFGSTYHKTENGFQQKKHLGLWLTGKTAEPNWLTKPSAYNFYHLKTEVSNILSRFRFNNVRIEHTETNPYVFAASFFQDETLLATLGKVDNKTLKWFDIKNEVYFADINWDILLNKAEYLKTSFKELPKFPSVRRDLAMLIDRNLSFEAIEKIAKAESRKWLQEVSLFDVYTGDKIEAGKKSYAISLTFLHPDKTFTDQEIEKMMNKLMAKYESELGAIIRKN